MATDTEGSEEADDEILELKERLATLEQKFAAFEQNGDSSTKRTRNPDRAFGIMAKFPEWEEVCRLGREISNTPVADSE